MIHASPHLLANAINFLKTLLKCKFNEKTIYELLECDIGSELNGVYSRIFYLFSMLSSTSTLGTELFTFHVDILNQMIHPIWYIIDRFVHNKLYAKLYNQVSNLGVAFIHFLYQWKQCNSSSLNRILHKPLENNNTTTNTTPVTIICSNNNNHNNNNNNSQVLYYMLYACLII